MTMTEARDIRDISRDTGRAIVRQIIESGGKPRASELPAENGMSERWWRDRINETKAEIGKPSLRAVPANGTDPAARPRVNGTAHPAPASKPPARKGGKAPARTPLPLLVFTGLAVLVVAAVCAVVSYIHIRDLAVIAGMGGLSGWLPLGIDGLAVACTCSLLADRRHNEIPHALARAGLLLGIGGSLVANVLAVDPELVPLRAVRWVLAAYPPLALAVSAHMLFRMMGERR